MPLLPLLNLLADVAVLTFSTPALPPGAMAELPPVFAFGVTVILTLGGGVRNSLGSSTVAWWWLSGEVAAAFLVGIKAKRAVGELIKALAYDSGHELADMGSSHSSGHKVQRDSFKPILQLPSPKDSHTATKQRACRICC